MLIFYLKNRKTRAVNVNVHVYYHLKYWSVIVTQCTQHLKDVLKYKGKR